ncbi:RNA degradosome polyphosphate kinase [uncultured Porphyromonas sp.]|uniref:RNA degradosome polyphosphate kinase n=1 Tax=uncultured Porphyromonas sp. TaxID=159274 RepID=UPI0026027830|nr:RNA degradosome polyphosphate kinase [uncultured Porphyromonas sp.]
MPHSHHRGRLPYIERDESWMYFNKRILLEAVRTDLPLLERFNYLGIYSNNLDEFFRVRVASLRRIVGSPEAIPSHERRKAKETLRTIIRLNKEYSELFDRTFADLLRCLTEAHIHIINEQQLTTDQEDEVLSFFMDKINGITNPIFINSPTFRPEQHLKEALYLVVVLWHEQGEAEEAHDVALLEVPTKELGRFLRLQDKDGESYLMFLDDVLRYCLPYIFIGREYAHYEAYTFKFTKDAEFEIEQDLRSSVIEMVSRGVKRRGRGEAVRVVYDDALSPEILRRLSDMAELNYRDMRIGGGRYHNMRDLMTLPDCGRSGLRFPKQVPLQMDEFHYAQSIISQVLRRDRCIHFPYYSFDHFLRLLQEAAISEDVTEIRISLYRVAQNSKVVKALMTAAQNGKRVTAVVELLARFDEQSNISWGKKMQDSGINVVLGHEKLKVHSKLVYIGTKRGNIACIGSGNLHEGTACLYTDLMLMTAHKGIVRDVAQVFDFIERPFINTHFHHLLVAPNDMRQPLYQMINKEIRLARAGKEAFIRLKLNHVVDEKMVAKLYEASTAGVRVELCLRGNCSLIPGVPGYSEDLFINAIISRYLEHSRIYIFGNGGEPKYYIGSTDWMTRNLDRRIEVMTPVYDPDIQRELDFIISAGLRDTEQGYYINAEEVRPRREDIADKTELFNSQQALYQYYLAKKKEENHG